MIRLLAKRNNQIRRVSGGSSWTDAIYSSNAVTGEYILYKCGKLQRELAKENIVVEAALRPFHRFRVCVSGKIAFEGDFGFVERCRTISSDAFIETMRQHIRVVSQAHK